MNENVKNMYSIFKVYFNLWDLNVILSALIVYQHDLWKTSSEHKKVEAAIYKCREYYNTYAKLLPSTEQWQLTK